VPLAKRNRRFERLSLTTKPKKSSIVKKKSPKLSNPILNNPEEVEKLLKNIKVKKKYVR
jgi:hypothetical protein